MGAEERKLYRELYELLQKEVEHLGLGLARERDLWLFTITDGTLISSFEEGIGSDRFNGTDRQFLWGDDFLSVWITANARGKLKRIMKDGT